MNVGSLNVMKSVNTPSRCRRYVNVYDSYSKYRNCSNEYCFQDPIPSGTAFVANSVTINGVVARCGSMAGFPSTKYSGRTNGYDYVSSYVTSVPSGGNVRNQSNVTASFLINPANPPITTVTNSNFE